MNDKMITPQNLDFYIDFVNQFFKTGRVPHVSINLTAEEPFLHLEDPILDYLRNHFSKVEMDKEALSDPLHKAAYRNAIISFLTELLKTLKICGEDGDGKIKKQAQKIEYVYRKGLQVMKEAIEENKISLDDLARLGDGFNEYAIKSTIELLNTRKRYPSLEKILSLLGRRLSEEGEKMEKLMSGNHNLPHSGGSDIQGVTMGQSFASLLPLETALFSDSQTEDIFLHKYIDHQLQLFHHKSESGKTSTCLNNTKLKNRGPMIICLDTSESMRGRPMDIAILLVSNILIEAQQQKRDCLLIVFSEEIEVIDLKKLWKKYKGHSLGGYEDFIPEIPMLYGGTDVSDMLIEIFDLWEGHADYQLADVLVISDFEIPIPSDELLSMIMYYRDQGYSFYGYQIGNKDSALSPYFDKIIQHEGQ